MALSPLSSSSIVSILDVLNRTSKTKASSSVVQNGSDVQSETSASNAVEKARKGSVLYQVVSKLLVTDDDKTNSDSKVSQSDSSSDSETENRPNYNPQTSTSSEGLIYNRLLTTRLVGNEQFLRNLKEQDIESNGVGPDVSDESGERIIQLSEYRQGNDRKSITEIMSTYREISSREDE